MDLSFLPRVLRITFILDDSVLHNSRPMPTFSPRGDSVCPICNGKNEGFGDQSCWFQSATLAKWSKCILHDHNINSTVLARDKIPPFFSMRFLFLSTLSNKCKVPQKLNFKIQLWCRTLEVTSCQCPVCLFSNSNHRCLSCLILTKWHLTTSK